MYITPFVFPLRTDSPGTIAVLRRAPAAVSSRCIDVAFTETRSDNRELLPGEETRRSVPGFIRALQFLDIPSSSCRYFYLIQFLSASRLASSCPRFSPPLLWLNFRHCRVHAARYLISCASLIADDDIIRICRSNSPRGSTH